MRVFTSTKEHVNFRNWIDALEAGDEVTNVIKYGFQRKDSNDPVLKILKVKNRTDNGRIRLEDNTLWNTLGTPVSRNVLGQLNPVKESHREYLAKFNTTH